MKEPTLNQIRNKKRGRFFRHMSIEEARAILGWLADNNFQRDFVLFMTHLSLGRRICETVAIKLEDFLPDLSYLTIRLAKTDQIKKLYIPEQLRTVLYKYIQTYRKEIYASGGWLFYSFNHNCKTQHVSRGQAIQALRRAVIGAGINDLIPGVTDARGKPIHRIGTHSFRRLSTTKLLRQTGGDIRFVSKYRGDVRPDTVFTYDGFEEFEEKEREESEKFFSNLVEPSPSSVIATGQIKKLVEEELSKRLKQLLQPIPQ